MTLHRAIKLGVACCAILALLLAALSCGKLTPTATPSPSPSPTAPLSGSVDIKMSGLAFVPAEVTVKAGTKITWTNQDAVLHTVTADDKLFDSGMMANNASFSYTFDSKGIYGYYCSYHLYMKGKVTVVD